MMAQERKPGVHKRQQALSTQDHDCKSYVASMAKKNPEVMDVITAEMAITLKKKPVHSSSD